MWWFYHFLLLSRVGISGTSSPTSKEDPKPKQIGLTMKLFFILQKSFDLSEPFLTKKQQHFKKEQTCLNLVLKCVLVIRTQVDSRDTSLFTPVSTMQPQGFQLQNVIVHQHGCSHSCHYGVRYSYCCWLFLVWTALYYLRHFDRRSKGPVQFARQRYPFARKAPDLFLHVLGKKTKRARIKSL